jgi:SAM-dependent methyltransferase
MNPIQIGQSYDRLADQWNSDEFNRSNGIEQHKRAIAFVNEHRNALDVGCGSSGRFIDLLIDSGFHVEGIDVSEQMIALARQRHPDVLFYHEDFRIWDFPRKYDFITAWDSLWHLPLDDQEPALRKMCNGLTKGGVLVFTTGGLDGPDEKTDSAMGPPMYYSALGIPRTLELVAQSGCVCKHLEYDQHPELHLFIIAQKI